MLKACLEKLDWHAILPGLVGKGDQMQQDVWFRGSVPITSGMIKQPALQASVEIVRDVLGVPCIEAETAADAFYALGFLHAQERYFQMDLYRRLAAGEMAELLGRETLDLDKHNRRWLLRSRARQALALLPEDQRQQLSQYTRGVNAGMEAKIIVAFEYVMLRTSPARWQEEDCLLVLYALAMELQQQQFARKYARGLIARPLSAQQRLFLLPSRQEEGPDSRGTLPAQPPAWWARGPGDIGKTALPSTTDVIGSHASVVSAARSITGRAMLANDFHLPLMLPNTWFRVTLNYATEHTSSHTVSGITLPGTPAILTGCNENIAWGMTNAFLDTCDWLQTRVAFKHWPGKKEVLYVKNADPEVIEVVTSPWGPVVSTPLGNLAMRWIMHIPQAINMGITGLHDATSVDEALSIGAAAGLPAMNLLVADNMGHIGWTLAGTVPERNLSTEDCSLPVSAVDPWEPHALEPLRHPRIQDPVCGFICIDPQHQKTSLPDSMAAEALSQEHPEPTWLLNAEALCQVDSDDDSLVLIRWRKILESEIQERDLAGFTLRTMALDAIRDWDGDPSTEDPGYALLRLFRDNIYLQLFGALDEQLDADWPQAGYLSVNPDWDDMVFQVIESGTPAWVPKGFRYWRTFILYHFDKLLGLIADKGESLELSLRMLTRPETITHPIARQFPALRRWLTAPDNLADHAPVNRTGVGSSARIVVSPGDFSGGCVSLPGGQSAHPMSPWFLAGHAEWAAGKYVPLLASEKSCMLVLNPCHGHEVL